MLRTTSKISADRRTAAPYAAARFTDAHSTVWTFWSMAPGSVSQHWVTDGRRFALADAAGLVKGARAGDATSRTIALLDADGGSRIGATLRVADDQFSGRCYNAPSCLVVPESKLGTPREVTEALAAHALNGRPPRAAAECLKAVQDLRRRPGPSGEGKVSP